MPPRSPCERRCHKEAGFGRRLPAVNAVREEQRSIQTSEDSRHLTPGDD
uniref:Uncharacterized protein n=1 Tax=Nothobranchius furzeri TaxID=105023 RepID=A0A1A8UKV1_NOTFU